MHSSLTPRLWLLIPHICHLYHLWRKYVTREKHLDFYTWLLVYGFGGYTAPFYVMDSVKSFLTPSLIWRNLKFLFRFLHDRCAIFALAWRKISQSPKMCMLSSAYTMTNTRFVTTVWEPADWEGVGAFMTEPYHPSFRCLCVNQSVSTSISLANGHIPELKVHSIEPISLDRRQRWI